MAWVAYVTLTPSPTIAVRCTVDGISTRDSAVGQPNKEVCVNMFNTQPIWESIVLKHLLLRQPNGIRRSFKRKWFMHIYFHQISVDPLSVPFAAPKLRTLARNKAPSAGTVTLLGDNVTYSASRC